MKRGEGGVEFFVAFGDAAVGLQAGKEIFDAVALPIQTLVEVRFNFTIGLRGYEGAAALLVHISTDSVAEVSSERLLPSRQPTKLRAPPSTIRCESRSGTGHRGSARAKRRWQIPPWSPGPQNHNLVGPK